MHRDPTASSSTATAGVSEAPEDDEYSCSICFEKPVTFGLLGKCYSDRIQLA